MLLTLVAMCPRQSSPDARQRSVARASGPAAPRLLFVPLSAAGRRGDLADRRTTRSRPVAAEQPSADTATATQAPDSGSAGEAARVDSIAVPTTTAPPMANATASDKGYERPVHPALRGLVPSGNGGPLWTGSLTATLLPASLAPRPPECVRDQPEYYACSSRLLRWRDDSIYHVSFRCRRDTLIVAQRLPADYGRYLRDSSRPDGR